MHKAKLTTALVDYISPFFHKRINSTCLYIYQLIYLSIHNDRNQYCGLGHESSCY